MASGLRLEKEGSIKAIKSTADKRPEAPDPASSPLRTEVGSQRAKAADYQEGKRRLRIVEKRGEAFHDCASMHPDYICCNVKVLAAVSNCPYECSYCFLQNYLTDPGLSVVGDTDALLREVDEKTAREPNRFFRVGTWELGDSLALEPFTDATADLVRAFAARPNLLLELRTKSAEVDGLLDLPHEGRTVVSWSLNPGEVIRREEYRTAPLAVRIEAMGKVIEAGYPVALHFDPMIYYPDWRSGYRDLVERVFAIVRPERVAWISIGSLRFNPEMKRKMEDSYPGSRATCAEMLLGDDGKMRYLKPLRVEMYQGLKAMLAEHGCSEIFTYLCMERADVWKRVLDIQPESSGHHDYLLTLSLFQRFPGLLAKRPLRKHYEQAGEQCGVATAP